MEEIVYGIHVEDDLLRLPQNHGDDIEQILNEILNCPRSLEGLLDRHGEYANPYFDVKAICGFLSNGYNISRIRSLVPPYDRYRVLFAPDFSNHEFIILAVVERLNPHNPQPHQYNYELDNPITRRIFEEYDDNGLQRLQG